VLTSAGKQPKFGVNAQGVMQLVYGNENTVYCSQASPDAATFGEPQAVGSLPGGLMLGMGRGPQLATARTTTVIAAVDKQGNLFSWRAGGNGRGWEGPVRINDVDTVAKEGFVALVPGKGDQFFAFWNDLRTGNNQIYGALSPDGGKTWEKSKLVYSSPDTTICECCKVSAASDRRGKLYIMWRNQLNGYRDMYMLPLNEKLEPTATAAKLGSGTWKLDGCPMDGGNLSVDAQGKVMTAWMREGKVFVSRPGEPEQLIGTGRNPVAVIRQNQPMVLWNTREEVLLLTKTAEKPTSLGKGSYPQVSLNGDGTRMMACWEGDKGEILYKMLLE
jgi:hypothetical protein